MIYKKVLQGSLFTFYTFVMRAFSYQRISLATNYLDELRALVRALNTPNGKLQMPDGGWIDHQPVRGELRRLVATWFDSRRNVSRLFDIYPQLAELALEVSARIIPTQGSLAKLFYISLPHDRRLSGCEFAQRLFLGFLVNPSNELLGGPCYCCGTYFITRTKRRKTCYCSAECGRRFTSRLANAQRRAKEKDQLVEVARQTIRDFTRAGTKLPWKDWVSQKSAISKTWFTRAVRSKLISEPDGKSERDRVRRPAF